jgi:hypothetical protein
LQSALRADPTHANRLQRWITQLHERKGYHKTLIAIANKHARMLWAMLAKNERYDADAWQREFASFLGLVPRQSGTGGKIRLGSISKLGNPYLRTLLIHGARSVMCHAKAPTAWQKGIQERRPANVAAVALANKMARTAWAILAHSSTYEKNHMRGRAA